MSWRGRAWFGRWPALVSALPAVLAWAVPVLGNHVVMHRGPFAGVVVHLQPHPEDAATLYLVAFGGGVYKSVDGGRGWVAVSRGLEEALTVLTLAMDPVDPRVLYAGTDAGLFVSLDGGARWRRRGLAISDRNIRSLAVAPTRPTVLYAGTDQGVLWSWNLGETWSARSTGIGLRDVRVVRLDPARQGRIFAAGFGGIFRSEDNGRRWRAVNRGLADLRVRALALDPTRPDVVYAGTAGSGVFVTGDGGGRWRPLNEGLRNLTVLSLLVTPGGERFAGTVGGVYRWDPVRLAWELVGEDVLTLTITFVATNPHRPGTVYAGTGGFVFVSDDRGRRWRELAVSVGRPGVPQPVSAGLGRPAGGHSHNERR